MATIFSGKIDLRKLNLGTAPYTERVCLRWIRDDDPEEMRRLVAIDLDEDVRRYVLNATADEDDLRLFAVGRRGSIGVAVAGKKDHAGEEEEGKLQGWISVYSDHPRRLTRAQEKGLLVFDRQKIHLEVGFARHPMAISGQMGSGLRCLVAVLSSHFEKKNLKWCLTGYTHPGNEGSKRVLVAAGFRHIGEIPYTKKDKHSDHVYWYEPLVG